MDDKREGKGLYTWKNQETYKGEWSKDRMHGIGKMKKDTEFIGVFCHDQFVRPAVEEELGSLRYYL